jgi:tetratricopeptide (TPR) repeat protein
MNLKCAIGMHHWAGCKCSECGKTREEAHDWAADCEKCAKCGKSRAGAHTWTGCTCSKCGKKRDDSHDWTTNYEKCAKCGKVREPEYVLVRALLARIMKAKDDNERVQAVKELKAMGDKSFQPLLWEAFNEQGDPTLENIDEFTIRMAVWCGCALHPIAFEEFYRTKYKTGLSPHLDRMRRINMTDGIARKTMIHRLASPLAKFNSGSRSYAEDCLHCEWVEVEDPRRWSEFPDCRRIQEMANNGQTAEALALVDKVLPQFRDYYFVYMWKMLLLSQLNRTADAESAFAEGLSNCREKYYLCSNWAKIEYRVGNLNEAVRWWIRSVVSESSLHTPQSENAFLYLAYVAKFLGDPSAEQKLFATVDRLTRMGRYNDEEQARIRALVSSQGTDAMKEAISLLCSKHLK